jgi:hypothetical protein
MIGNSKFAVRYSHHGGTQSSVLSFRRLSLLFALLCLLLSLFLLLNPAAADDVKNAALVQAIGSEYQALWKSLLQKYTDGIERAKEMDYQYGLQHHSNTIRHQVNHWTSAINEGLPAIFSAAASYDFDTATMLWNAPDLRDGPPRDAAWHALGHTDYWPEEIKPARAAIRQFYNGEDYNEFQKSVIMRIFPHLREFSTLIEKTVAGFFQSLDQTKLTYYYSYDKTTRQFTYTWPECAKLVNFFEGKNYDIELQSNFVSGCSMQEPVFLNLDLKSSDNRNSVGLFVDMGLLENGRIQGTLAGGDIVDQGGNCIIVKQNDYYRLIHFFKGRRTIAVIYQMQTHPGSEEMIRYLIFALRDYVQSGGGGAPSGPPQPAAGPVLEIEPLTSTNLVTTPNPGNTCTLRGTMAAPKAKGVLVPVKGATVLLEQPTMGTLSTMRVVTDSNGQADITYTAPTEDDLSAAGKMEVEIFVYARGPDPGAKDQILIHVRSRTSNLVVTPEHEILPAHAEFYNPIRMSVRAADKTDGSPYRARISAAGQYGSLVKERGQHGGTATIEVDLWPNNDSTVHYHWTGPPPVKEAWTETITVEIPELNLSRQATFSVGIDPRILSVGRRNGGVIYPLLFEAINVRIEDTFHRDTDVEKLCETFDIRPSVAVSQKYFNPVYVSPREAGMLSALFTRLESVEPKKAWIRDITDGTVITRDGEWVVVGQAREGASGRIVDPGVMFLQRGTYQFEVTIGIPKGDGDPRNNKALSDVFEVTEFENIGAEVFHTVFLPSAEFLIEVGVSFAGKLATQLPMFLSDFYQSVKAKDYQGAFIGAVGFAMDMVDKSGNLSKISKQVIKMGTLSGYTSTLVEEMTAEPAAKSAVRAAPAGRLPDNVLEISRLSLQGSPEHYLIILQRQGLVSHGATSDGTSLKPTAGKITKDQDPSQRIQEGARYIVIPAETSETLTLDLSGTGGGGELVTVTAHGIGRYAYPTGAWRSTVMVDGSGRATFTSGQALTPTQESAVPGVSFAGTWKSSFGTMTITQDGSRILGDYSHDRGKIEGTIEGSVVKGKWSESPSYKPPRDAGDFEFTLSADGTSFSGKWRYGFGTGPWKGDWKGTRQ